MCRCNGNCRLCNRIRISQSITYTAPNTVINLVAGGYNDDEKYCIVTAQPIPSTATVNSPVVVTVGTGTQQYPLVNPDGTQVTAGSLRTRTRYATICQTTPTSAVFRLCRGLNCPENGLVSVNGTAVTTQVTGSDT